MRNKLTVTTDFDLRNQDFYQALLDDCKAIVIEHSFNSRMEIVKGKWELGQRIYEENELEDRKKTYGKSIVETLAKDLQISNANLWFCIQFYKKFPEKTFSKTLEKLPEGKDISWYKIMTKYLGRPEDEKKGKPRTTYKVAEIEEVFKNYFLELGSSEAEVEEWLEGFMKRLLKPRK